MNPSEPGRKRVLAIDPGSKRVGIAVSNSDRSIAFPRPALLVDDQVLVNLRRLVDEEQIGTIVVGLPKTLSGSEGSSAHHARALAKDLDQMFQDDEIEVALHDERLTTVQAQQNLHEAGVSSKDQKNVIDSASATILLEAWIRCQ